MKDLLVLLVIIGAFLLICVGWYTLFWKDRW